MAKEKIVIHLYDERGNDKLSRVSVGCREVFRGSYDDCVDRVETIQKSFDLVGTAHSFEEKVME